jgi:CHAD domain-containing protein
MENAVPLTQSTPFRDAAKQLVETPLEATIACLDGVRRGDDIEAVHDIRVATRRLRAVISAIEPAYPGKPLRRLEQAAASLTDLLGEARDTDVFIEHLDKEIALLGDGRAYERIGIEAFRDSLSQLRESLQKKVLIELEKTDAETLRSLADAVFEDEEESI